MKYFGLKNLSSQEAFECNPMTWGPHPGYPESKEDFRIWQGHPQTDHLFYTAVEGLIPSARLTVQNPPFKMYGWVLDYDNKGGFIKTEDVASLHERAPSGLCPTWTSRTMTGGVHLVYEFEKPVLIDNKELTDAFLKNLAKELKVKNLLPGFDDANFHVHLQYYEVGRDWHQVKGGAPIKDDWLGLQFFHAATKKKIYGEGLEIPIEAVAAEVERQFPGRWKGDFAVGVRGPLFWINDGIDRTGCQVGDHGVICYSERAGKSFLHWGEVLGQDFVKAYEAERVGAAAADLWFDGKSYWTNHEGRWHASNKDDAASDLKVAGLSGKTGAKDTASEIDKVLSAVRHGTQRVDGAVPIVHNKNEVVHLPNGNKYLNISTAKVIQPADSGDPEKFPWIYDWINKVWEVPCSLQRDVFLFWLKHYYQSALEGEMQAGQALIIAGDRNRGKTFFARQVIARALGGGAEASDYLLHRTSFNKACAESACWNVDDQKGADTWDKHDEFSNALKSAVANPSVLYHPKFRDAFDIPWTGRIIVTCNSDEKSLNIIPDMTGNIGDKLILVKMGSDWQPQFWAKPVLEAKIWKETPFFLRWLLDWEPTEQAYDPEKEDRFGKVRSYHHPDLLRASVESSQAGRLKEMLLEWRRQYRDVMGKKNEKTIMMTATQLRSSLANVPGFENSLREFGRNRLAQALMQMPPSIIVRTRIFEGSRQFEINLEG